jgi:hypothetical protein
VAQWGNHYIFDSFSFKNIEDMSQAIKKNKGI